MPGCCVGDDKKQQAKWKAESDLRALREAEDIKKDKGRLGAAEKMAQDEIVALNKVVPKGVKMKGRPNPDAGPGTEVKGV